MSGVRQLAKTSCCCGSILEIRFHPQAFMASNAIEAINAFTHAHGVCRNKNTPAQVELPGADQEVDS